MTKNYVLIVLILLFTANSSLLFSQTIDSIPKYQRSSLTMILLQGTNLEADTTALDAEEVQIDNSAQAITRLWHQYPFPDMYDEHTIVSPSIEVVSNLSSKDIFEARRNSNQQKDAEATLPKIEEELKNKKIAHQVVRRWFSSEDGSQFWNMGTIQERGFYNASELDAAIASRDVRGRTKLADAGEELLNNSFVTVTDLLVYANKPVATLYFNLADQFYTQANAVSDKGGTVGLIASGTLLATAAGFKIAGEAIKDGYTVVSKTYLFKLKWNEEVQAVLYQNWENEEAFEAMNFELEYVGFQLNETVVNRGSFNSKANRDPQLVITQSVVRNIDNAFVKLQQDNDVFRPTIPVLKNEPIRAQIGMKEGLEGGEKFDVLEKYQEPVTAKVMYKKVGVVTVDKARVWDNRYNAGEEPEVVTLDAEGNPINVTYFQGGKNIYPGMLLKQQKSKKKKK